MMPVSRRTLALLTVTTLGTLGTLAAAPAARAQSVTVGTPDLANAFPFDGYNGAQFQQLYAGTAFAGPMTIRSILFHEFGPTPTPLGFGAATYTVRFGYTSAPISVAAPATSLASFLTPTTPFQTFFSGPLAGGYQIVGSTPFDYDPALGNLLLDIGIASPPNGQGGSFAVSVASGVSSRITYYNAVTGTAGPFQDWYGLVTTFETQPSVQPPPYIPPDPNTVPEPATTALLGAGLLALGAVRRRRAAHRVTIV